MPTGRHPGYPRPRKRFGQHFLRDPRVIQSLLTCIQPGPEDHLVEIGPGRGAITHPLLPRVGRLDVIELDRDLIEPLKRRCSGAEHLGIHGADALDFDLCGLAVPGERLRIVGNLPYNLSTPLLFRFLDQIACIRDLHLMLQREVVERILAQPGTKTYGRLSVMVQTRCSGHRCLRIAPEAFHPPPKVESAFLRLEPWDPPRYPILDPARHAQLVARAFSQRRKTLRNALRGFVTEAQLLRAGISGDRRAEQVSVATFATLANQLAPDPPDPSPRDPPIGTPS